ncbi:hypothetical protein TWF102_002650 [Orbilia oligospora]|uniref:Phosphatidylinositol-specific phospholipase C X domain-containing protein n=1 Tax=Orbilia oligospora TaxID=2813651 RepID=A0A7C8NAZ1_ORBOL|nr:hypothetical protein TWF102_002650 [Orbilia oligospora]KAF3116198.1 hypothetical protein TWF103_009423 [Orbilia oligospora]
MRPLIPFLISTATALVAVPRPPLSDIKDLDFYSLYDKRSTNVSTARGLGTSADMYIFNDWSTPITFSSYSHSRMSKSPPGSVPLSTFSASSGYAIEASGWIPLQSSFKYSFSTPSTEKGEVKVDIGMTPWKTGYSINSGKGFETGVLLAPAKILAKGRDFDFYFFSGPGVMGPLINSVLDANLGAFFAGVKKNPQKVAVNGDIDLTIKEFLNPAVRCKYSSVTPGTGANLWTVNAILDITSEVKMKVRYKKVNQDAVLKLKNLSILVSANMDFSELSSANLANVANIKLSVTSFQTSVEGIDVDGDILVDIVGVLYPVFAPVLRLPYKLASIVNTSENKNILGMINAAIGSLGLRQTTIAGKRWMTLPELPSLHLKGLFKRFISTLSTKKTTRSIENISTWMSDPKIQELALSSLYIPGTHDSHAYDFDHVLSSMKYSDIAFLWDFDYFLPAPSDGSFNPLTMTPIHLGPVLGQYTMNSVAHIAKAQGSDILSQLNGGVRHFDLRIYYDPIADTFYSQHGLRAKPTFVDLLTQVQTFLEANPSAAELIILDISHTNFNQDFTLEDGTVIPSVEVQFKYLGVIRQLESWAYMPINARGTRKFNFQTLKDTKLSQITQGSNKVLFINPDIVLPEISVNTDGWMYVPSSGVMPKGGLYEISTAAALTPGEILGNVLNGLSGQGEKDMLKVKAEEGNRKVVEMVKRLEGQKGTKVQLVSVDWWDVGGVVEGVVGLNYN